MKDLDTKLRALYLFAAKLVEAAMVVFAAHFLIKGDLEAVTGITVMFLICNAQARITELEQEVKS